MEFLRRRIRIRSMSAAEEPIGLFMSREDMEVIDLGVPLLSMHSPFEMSSKLDVWDFYRTMTAFYMQ
jgi:aspartyl aminopeptidase